MDRKEMGFSEQNKLKILLLTWEYPPHIIGGLSRHTEGLSLSLNKNGVEVHVITTKLPNEGDYYENQNGVNVHRVEPLNALDHHFLNWVAGLNVAMVQKALMLKVEHSFDIIHAHDWLVGEAAQILTKQFNIPLITTIHATEYGRNGGGIYTELQRFIHQKEEKLTSISQHIIVCSEFMKEEVGEIFSLPKEKISIIPNGVHMENDINQVGAIPHPLLEQEKRKIIFSIGRLVKEKGFDLLIEAAARLDSKEFCFVIAGTGPMYHEYEQLIRKYQLEKDVYLVGFITDNQRDQFFRNSAMAIFPSRYEPFGIVALEAMKYACPIIVSDTGGLRGIIKHLETGLFMESGKVDSLIEQIERLNAQPNIAELIAENGRTLVEHLYSWKRVAGMTEQVYEEQHLLFSIDEKLQDLYLKKIKKVNLHGINH